MSNPVYTFKCREHGEHDVPGKLGAPPPTVVSCPVCFERCYRVYRAPGVQYVGNGWTGAQRNRTARKANG